METLEEPLEEVPGEARFGGLWFRTGPILCYDVILCCDHSHTPLHTGWPKNNNTETNQNTLMIFWHIYNNYM